MSALLADVIQRTWQALVRHGSIRTDCRRAHRFARFGDRTEITFPSTSVSGEHRIAVGSGTVIGPLATLSAGMPDDVDRPGPVIVSIGDGCLLGKGIGIVGHERIDIGDDVFCGHYVYITDQNHGYEDLDLPIGRQLWSNAPVRVGAGSWLGHGAVILPGTTIGVHTVVAAGAVVAGTFPDNCVLAGVPARVVRHHDGRSWTRPPGPSLAG